MEKVDYRSTLEWLYQLFDGKVVVCVSEVSRKFSIDRRMAEKRYPFVNGKIELTRLASIMCLSQQEIRGAYHLN